MKWSMDATFAHPRRIHIVVCFRRDYLDKRNVELWHVEERNLPSNKIAPFRRFMERRSIAYKELELCLK